MRRKSLNSVKIRLFKLKYEEVMEKLREYAERAVSKGARAVILIGSLARGDFTAFSDADVIIVSENVPKNPLERLKDFMDPTLPVDLEPRVYTTEELLNMAKEKRRIAKEIAKHGKTLAGDKRIIETVKEFLRENSLH